MSPVKILIIPGSLRSGSHNVRLAGAAMAELVEAGAEVSLISLADFPLPIYDGDLEARSGVPTEAVNLKRMIGAHHGVLLVSPEYNSSPPPLLKNALDWVTRVRERDEPPGRAMRGRPFALASASTGRFGGARSLMPRHRYSYAVIAVVCRSGLRRVGSAPAWQRPGHADGHGAAVDRSRGTDEAT